MIPWEIYLIKNNPFGVNRVAEHFGIEAPGASEDRLIRAVEFIVSEFGDDGIEALMREHPDYDVIRQIVLKDAPKKKKTSRFNGFEGGASPVSPAVPIQTNTGDIWDKVQSTLRINDLEKANQRVVQALIVGASVGITFLILKLTQK